MNPAVTQLADAWSEAIDSYQVGEASRIAKDLLPRLIQSHAIDHSTGITVGRWVYWARLIGGAYEVARQQAAIG